VGGETRNEVTLSYSLFRFLALLTWLPYLLLIFVFVSVNHQHFASPALRPTYSIQCLGISLNLFQIAWLALASTLNLLTYFTIMILLLDNGHQSFFIVRCCRFMTQSFASLCLQRSILIWMTSDGAQHLCLSGGVV